MNDLLIKILKKQDEFKELTPCLQEFLLQFFELFISPNGCKESNKYFAKRLNISVKNVEVRFKKLREANIISTDLSSFFDPNFNSRGFVTLRTNSLTPEFKAKIMNEYDRVLDYMIKKKFAGGSNDNI